MTGLNPNSDTYQHQDFSNGSICLCDEDGQVISDSKADADSVKKIVYGSNPSGIIAKGEIWTGVGNTLQDVATKLSTALQVIHDNWQGDAATAAHDNLSKLQATAASLAENSFHMGTGLQTIGRAVQTAQQSGVSDDNATSVWVGLKNGTNDGLGRLPTLVQGDVPPTDPSSRYDERGVTGPGPGIGPGGVGPGPGPGIGPGPGLHLTGPGPGPGTGPGPGIGPGGIGPGGIGPGGYGPGGIGPGGYGPGGVGPGGIGSGIDSSSTLAGLGGGGGLGPGGGVGPGPGLGGGAGGLAGGGMPGGGLAGGSGGNLAVAGGPDLGGPGSQTGMGRAAMPMMHSGGGNDEQERERTTWLTEDDDLWGHTNAPPPIVD